MFLQLSNLRYMIATVVVILLCSIMPGSILVNLTCENNGAGIQTGAVHLLHKIRTTCNACTYYESAKIWMYFGLCPYLPWLTVDFSRILNAILTRMSK